MSLSALQELSDLLKEEKTEWILLTLYTFDFMGEFKNILQITPKEFLENNTNVSIFSEAYIQFLHRQRLGPTICDGNLFNELHDPVHAFWPCNSKYLMYKPKNQVRDPPKFNGLASGQDIYMRKLEKIEVIRQNLRYSEIYCPYIKLSFSTTTTTFVEKFLFFDQEFLCDLLEEQNIS